MTGGGKSAGRTGAALAARNKQIVLDYVDALRRQDRSAIDAALSQNFRYLRLNDRLSRFEYLDALERTVLTTHAPKLDVMFIAADGDSVSVELALEFEFEYHVCDRGRRAVRNARIWRHSRTVRLDSARPRLVLDRVAQQADPFDFDFHYISGFHE
jgi:hypothetical protein